MPKPPSPSCCWSLYGPMTLPTLSRGGGPAPAAAPIMVEASRSEERSAELCGSFMDGPLLLFPGYDAAHRLRNGRVDKRATDSPGGRNLRQAPPARACHLAMLTASFSWPM